MSIYRAERDGDLDELLRLLVGSDEPAVRARAAEAIGSSGNAEDAVGRLIETAREDEEEAVRAAAIDALDRIGEDAIERLVVEMTGADADGADWATARSFVEALSADAPELRMAAANALGRLDDPGVVSELVDALSDPNPEVRARVARACGSIGDPRAREALIDRARDDHAIVRREVAGALGEIRGEGALEALVSALSDPSDDVRRVAVAALGKFAREEPIEHLVGALGDDTEYVRRAAVYSIIELLSNVPTERSHGMRESVVDVLRATDDPAVVRPLVRILEESNRAGQRRNTAWLLGRIAGEDPDEQVLGALVDALGDEDEMTSQFAATSLARIGGEEVERALLDALPEAPEDARARIVFALGKVGGDRARERLDRLIDDAEDDAVRRRAFAALSKLGGR